MKILHKCLALMLSPLVVVLLLVSIVAAICMATISFFYELGEELKDEWLSFKNDQNTDHYRPLLRQWVKLWRGEYVKE